MSLPRSFARRPAKTRLLNEIDGFPVRLVWEADLDSPSGWVLHNSDSAGVRILGVCRGFHAPYFLDTGAKAADLGVVVREFIGSDRVRLPGILWCVAPNYLLSLLGQV